jgi:hypothetical protein
MGPLLFTCPKTKQQAPAGIETDFETLRATWSESYRRMLVTEGIRRQRFELAI